MLQVGADVQGERVRFEPGMCRTIVQASAPAEFVQHARNPANAVTLGGANTVLAPGWGPPFIHNLDEGRRYATIEDFRTLIKICHSLPEYHHSGGVICEPVDLPANKRHLDMLEAHFRYSDRAVFGALIGAERAQDSVDMAKIVFGTEFVAANCCLYAVSNSNAPLVWDSAMTGALKVYARNNQAVAVTPWTLAGAMSPCTAAGTMAQVLAEALAGLPSALRLIVFDVVALENDALDVAVGVPTHIEKEGHWLNVDGLRRDLAVALVREPVVLLAVIFLVALVIAAVFANWIAPYDPLLPNIFSGRLPPLSGIRAPRMAAPSGRRGALGLPARRGTLAGRSASPRARAVGPPGSTTPSTARPFAFWNPRMPSNMRSSG